jgi:hypothetical protein
VIIGYLKPNGDTMTADDLITALERQTFEIESPRIILTQNTEINPIIFKGKGHVRQTEDDALAFELFATESENSSSPSGSEFINVSAGARLLVDIDYYTLSLITDDGREWIADRVIVSDRSIVDGFHPTLKGIIESSLLNRTEYTSDGYSLRLCFFDDVSLPYRGMYIDGGKTYIRTIDKFTAAGADFFVREEDRRFWVEATSSEPLNESFHTRIVESLCFLLAKSVTWRVMLRTTTSEQCIELAAAKSKAQNASLEPPIASISVVYREYGWMLFSRYLDYVTTSTLHPYWNTCSYHLYNACEASTNSLHLWAIGVCVAVEGLCDLIEIDKKPEDEEFLKNLRKFIVEQISSHPDFSPFTNRVQGLLGSMKNDGVAYRLKSLVPSGHVDESLIKTWQNLRNKEVHPTEADLKDLSIGSHQKIFEQIQQSTVLMYQIIFYLIGYNGKFTNHAAPKCPAKDYPLVLPKTELD